MANATTEWSSGLCACRRDYHICCSGFWCCFCNACSTSEEFGEDPCLPLCDICTPPCMACCGLPCCIPPVGLALRVAIRHKYGIKGTLFEDIMVSSACLCCSWCQIRRELKYRRIPPPVVNEQPAAMMPMAQLSASPPKRATGFVVASY